MHNYKQSFFFLFRPPFNTALSIENGNSWSGSARLHFCFQAWTNDDDAHLAASAFSTGQKNCKKLVSQRAIRQLMPSLTSFLEGGSAQIDDHWPNLKYLCVPLAVGGDCHCLPVGTSTYWLHLEPWPSSSWRRYLQLQEQHLTRCEV